MKTTVPPKLTLEEVAEHFAHWRGHKKAGERIPQRLWLEAIGLVSEHGMGRVVKTLHLSGRDLKRQRARLEQHPGVAVATAPTPFVEIDRGLVEQALGPGGVPVAMELERPEGLRLRLQAANRAELLALLERFMGV